MLNLIISSRSIDRHLFDKNLSWFYILDILRKGFCFSNDTHTHWYKYLILIFNILWANATLGLIYSVLDYRV